MAKHRIAAAAWVGLSSKGPNTVCVSRTAGPHWSAPENYIGHVYRKYAPAVCAVPLMRDFLVEVAAENEPRGRLFRCSSCRARSEQTNYHTPDCWVGKAASKAREILDLIERAENAEQRRA